jgi:hypothetical protein
LFPIIETELSKHRISHLVKDKLLASGLNIKDVLIHIEPYIDKAF